MGVLMKLFRPAALILSLLASPALAVSGRPSMPAPAVAATVEHLYPEMSDDGDEWRSLLPIMLLDVSANSDPVAIGVRRTEASTR